MHRKIRAKGSSLNGLINLDAVLQTQSLREFDDLCTAPLHGFGDATNYYAQCSSGQFLPHVRIPTLIIRAVDDPFFANDIPHSALKNNPAITYRATQKGGHVGFVEGKFPWSYGWWAERQAARFLAYYLHRNSTD